MAAIDFLLLDFPWYLLVGWTIYAIVASVNYQSLKRTGWSNFALFESIPSLFISLGLFGTFTGIASGLIHFDPAPDLIKQSIQELLVGLKTAFYTSIYGMVFYLVFNKVVKYKISVGQVVDPDVENEIRELKAINTNLISLQHTLSNSIDRAIVESLKGIVDDVNNTFRSFIDQLVQKNFDKLTDSIERLTQWQKDYHQELISIKTAYESLVERHKQFVDTTQQWVDTLDEIAGQTSQLKLVIDEFKTLTDDNSRFSRLLDQIQSSAANMKASSESMMGFSDQLVEVKDAFAATRDEVTTWLNREDGVRDASNALTHTLTELRKFEISSIEKLDLSFNNRLEGTFQSLDKLLKQYILYLENQSEVQKGR